VDVIVEPVSGLWLMDAGLDSEPVPLDQTARYLGCQIGTLLFAQFVWQGHLELSSDRGIFSALRSLGCRPELSGVESPVGSVVGSEATGLNDPAAPSVVVSKPRSLIEDQQACAIGRCSGGCVPLGTAEGLYSGVINGH
jgi:hypothetical protein